MLSWCYLVVIWHIFFLFIKDSFQTLFIFACFWSLEPSSMTGAIHITQYIPVSFNRIYLTACSTHIFMFMMANNCPLRIIFGCKLRVCYLKHERKHDEIRFIKKSTLLFHFTTKFLHKEELSLPLDHLKFVL